MRRVVERCIYVLAAYCVSVSTVSASGYSNYFQGARAVGLAGAFAATAGDLSAIFYNPAGIVTIPGMSVQFGSAVTKYNTIIDYTPYIGLPSRWKTENVWLFLPTIYAAAKVSSELSVGFGFYSPMSYDVRFDPKWDARKFAVKSSLSTRSYDPVIAYQINSATAVGVGLRYITGSHFFGVSPLLDPPKDNTEVNDRYDMSGSGTGFSAGLLYTPDERVFVGISYRSPVTLKLDGSVRRTGVFNKQLGAHGTAKTDYCIPATFTAGVKYYSREDVFFSADIVWNQWSAVKKQVYESENPLLRTEKNRYFKDTFHYRFGMEYSTEFNFIFRTGYFYAPEQTRDEYIDPSFPETRREGGTIGVGWKSEKLSADAAYIHFFESNKFTSTVDVDQFWGSMKNNADEIIFSITYRIR